MHLFLSPHYDDAVLSCGGLIARLGRAGERVVVRTVMGGQPSPEAVPDTPITHELHARWDAGENPVAVRRREDEAALNSLGAQADHLEVWMDCVYRTARDGRPLYATADSLFGVVHRDDVAGQLVPTLVLPPRDVVRSIYAPLGVGHHVDHQIVRDWGLELRQQYPWVALKFYEEYPYNQDPDALDAALEEVANREPPLKLEAEMIDLDAADVAAKVNAVGLYATQVSTFWVNTTAMDAAIRAALSKTGGGRPVERVWRVV